MQNNNNNLNCLINNYSTMSPTLNTFDQQQQQQQKYNQTTSFINVVPQQQQQQIIQINDLNSNSNGYTTINSLLNGGSSFKNIAIAPNVNNNQQTTPKKITKTLNIPNITASPQPQQQQQQTQQQLFNINILNTSPNNNNNNNSQTIPLNQNFKLINSPLNSTSNQQQQQPQQQSFIYTPSSNIQLLNTSQQPQQQQTATFILNNNSNNVIQQQPQQQQQAYININNRMVPVQTLNIGKQQQNNNNNTNAQIITPQLLQQLQQQQQQQQQSVKIVIPVSSSNEIDNNTNINNNSTLNRILVTTPTQQQQQVLPKQSNLNTYYVLQQAPATTTINNNTMSFSNLQPQQQQQQQQQQQKVNLILNNTTSAVGVSKNNITDKMKMLEQINMQLRDIQLKLATQVQQQSSIKLTELEQQSLDQLLQKRKEVQAEIQKLKQKLLSPATTNSPIVNGTSSSTEISIVNNNNTTAAAPATTILVPIVNKDTQNATNSVSTSGNSTTIRSISDLNLNDKIKLLNLIKTQIQQSKTSDTTSNEKYLKLVKMQNDLQQLILQQQQNGIVNVSTGSLFNNNNNNNSNDVQQQQPQQIIISNFDNNSYLTSTTTNNNNTNNPIAVPVNKILTISNTNATNIKNIFLPITTTTQQLTPTNNKKPLSSSIKIRNVPIASSPLTTTTVVQQSPLFNQKLKQLKSVSPVVTTQQYFKDQKAALDFKILNYDLLNVGIFFFNCKQAIDIHVFFLILFKLNNVINKNTDEKALKLLKQLDDKLLSLNDPEKQQAFIKNQVSLVDKYLKQFLLKNASKNGYALGFLKSLFFFNSIIFLDFMTY